MGSTTLFDNPTVKPPRLRRAPRSEYLYVRRVKGGAWQARVWLGAHAGGSLNLGLFTVARWETEQDAEWAAARAARWFSRFHGKPGYGLRETLEELKRRKFIPDAILPPRVRECGPGRYIGRVKKGGRVLATCDFECPWKAYAAMCEMLTKEFPRGESASARKAAERERRRGERAARERERYQGGVLLDFA